MNKLNMAKYMAELTDDVEHMDEQAQEAFAALLPVMAKLYRNDAKVKAVLILTDDDSQTLVRINADEYEANGMMHNALPMHEELMKAHAPDHGRMN